MPPKKYKIPSSEGTRDHQSSNKDNQHPPFLLSPRTPNTGTRGTVTLRTEHDELTYLLLLRERECQQHRTERTNVTNVFVLQSKRDTKYPYEQAFFVCYRTTLRSRACRTKEHFVFRFVHSTQQNAEYLNKTRGSDRPPATIYLHAHVYLTTVVSNVLASPPAPPPVTPTPTLPPSPHS